VHQLKTLYQHILDNGNVRGDRTGTGTIGVFGYMNRYNLQEGFPLCTTKKTFHRGIIEELRWFLNGSTTNLDLLEKNVHIWDEWALAEDVYVERPVTIEDIIVRLREKFFISRERAQSMMRLELANIETLEPFASMAEAYATYYKFPKIIRELKGKAGDLGPIYGKQWRSWPTADGKTIDQIDDIVKGLRKNPFSRRHLVVAWNPADLPDESISPQENVLQGKQALAPCHCLFQFYARPIAPATRADIASTTISGYSEMTREEAVAALESVPKFYLDCLLFQRSCDAALGLPFNIASYALLTMMMAQQTDMLACEFIHTFGDLHIYRNHLDGVREQLKRTPCKLPTMRIKRKPDSIFDYKTEDFELLDYECHPAIKFEISV
jgi:thymidylate synthase